MSSDFLVWRPGTMRDGICKLKQPTGIPDSFEIHEGISRIEGWPTEASAAMDPSFPKDIGLADSLDGTTFVVVSDAVRSFLGSEAAPKIETLPIRIINHKGHVASTAYFLLNPLAVVDCIDEEASAVELDLLDPGAFSECEQLVLRESEVPAELSVFRLEHWRSVIVIRKELAEKMKAASLTGLLFIEPQKYTGLI